jgi:8-amino-7-oxononanoate synthase
MYTYFQRVDESRGAVARIGGYEVIMCGSNSYLGLTHHEDVQAAAVDAIGRYGTGAAGSRFLSGNLALHEELEEELCAFVGMPAALAFPSGYQTNLGVINAIADARDQVVLDKFAHASMVDGTLLSRAKVARFSHNSGAALEDRLTKIGGNAGTMVLVDGVYSMDGDIADLVPISEICRRRGAALMVDDAHGIGVLANGRGTCAQLGVQADLVTVTFSKALASLGGAVLGDKRVIDHIRHTSRAMIFTTGASPADAAAALAALRIVKAEPWRCDRVLKLSDHLRTELQAMGLRVIGGGTPILAVEITHPAADQTQLLIKTQEVHKQLIGLGVYTNPVVPPAASCRLRLTLSAAHTDDHLGIVTAAFRKVADLIGRDSDDRYGAEAPEAAGAW